MSGGRDTVSRRNKRDVAGTGAGDISAVSAAGLPFLEVFSVECKCYSDLKLDAQFWALKGVFDTIWEVHRRKCKKIDRIPILLCKQFRRDVLLITNARGARIFQELGATPTATLHRESGRAVSFLFSNILLIPWKRVAKRMGVYFPTKL